MPKPRGKKNKKLRPVLHIFCEGEKTEPIYLNGYLKKFHSSNRLLQIVKVEKNNKTTPVQLVEEAIKLKEDKVTTSKDSFWVVYDREAKSKYPDRLHKEALDNAKSNEINVALTNVCFEVWLLLHFSFSTAAYSCFNDLLRHSSLKADLQGLGIKNYNKADNKLFDLISERIPDARSRAVRMNKTTLKSSYETNDKPHLLNPYTNVHLLLDAIDNFVKE